MSTTHTVEMPAAQMLTPEHPLWPLLTIPDALDAPSALWALGDLDRLAHLGQAVAILGTHRPTEGGERIAADFASRLAAAGRPVVAHAGFGIAPAVVRGVIAARFASARDMSPAEAPAPLVIQAQPADLMGSSEARRLAAEAQGAGGLVLSPTAPGAPTMTKSLAQAHLLTAHLCAAVLVIEAGATSRCLATARRAHAAGRPVYAVPGPITSTMSVGCHDLIREGVATLATDARDILPG